MDFLCTIHWATGIWQSSISLAFIASQMPHVAIRGREFSFYNDGFATQVYRHLSIMAPFQTMPRPVNL